MEPETETTEQPTAEEQTFTQADLDRLMTKERDKYARKAEAMEAKYRADLKRATMDEAERAKAEKDDRIKELESQSADLQREVRMAHAERALAKAGLSDDLAGIVIGDTDEATEANIKALSKAVKTAADAQYNARIAGAPKAPVTTDTSGQLSIAERNRLREAANLPPITN